MKCGDVVTVAAAENYGKPRPAAIVHTDARPEAHASVVNCQMTSEIVDASDFRITIDPTKRNGLRIRSRIIANKPGRVRRRRIGQLIGRLDQGDIRRLNVALVFVMGLAG